MTSPTVRGRALGATLVLVSGLVLASCGTSPGSAGSDAQIAASCPAKPLASITGIDITGSFASETLKTANMAIISSEVRRTAICGGELRVFAFASSTGGTAMLYDGNLQVSAPTDNARLRKATKLADQATATIAEHYDTALHTVTGSGSDPLGMLTLFEQANANYSDHTLINTLVTDGAQNVGIDPTAVPDTAAARALADAQSLPSLAGAEVVIVGIGKQGTSELPSTVIENLTAFWEQICVNTNAASCQVSTEGR